MGQTVPANERIDTKSYLRKPNAVTNSIRDISGEYRQNFVSDIKDGILRYGGAIPVNGVHLKVQGKNYYDFTLHHIVTRSEVPFENVIFELKNKKLLFVEVPDTASANNMKANINAGSVLHENLPWYQMVLQQWHVSPTL